MRDDDRYICLHVRSAGFCRGRDAAQRFRNTALESYYPLIQFLTEEGYWVFRMGDPSMPPPDLAQCGHRERVIDYAQSDKKSPELDLALCAQCALFASSSSGLHSIAHSFGRLVCEINHTIYAGFPWHGSDISIPQLYHSQKEGRVLRLDEILPSDLVYADHHFHFDRAGISLIPNSPDAIVDTVREALGASPHAPIKRDDADRTRQAFEQLNARYDRGISGKLGRYFSAKYAGQLLPPQ